MVRATLALTVMKPLSIAPASGVVATGPNFSIELSAAVARCRVWRRSDLSSAECARLAVEKVSHFRRLSRGVARAMILDVRDAPPVTGPSTQQSIGEMLEAWECARRPIAVVAGDAPIQGLQLARLIGLHAPVQGRLFGELREAEEWLSRLGIATASPAPSSATTAQSSSSGSGSHNVGASRGAGGGHSGR